IGLGFAHLLQPGVGFNVDVSKLDPHSVAEFTSKHISTVDFLMNIIPNTFVDAFAKGEILQVLFIAILFGFALSAIGERGKPVLRLIEDVTHAIFGVVNIIMQAAPIGAFGAMAFTIGKYGIGSLKQLGFLMANVYITCALFVFIVLGLIARLSGFSLLKFLSYIKEELLIVLGTSSSESALPRMMTKLENLGCSKPVVGMVIPTGYSFNLDGTSIYLTMAAIFIAQAMNVDLSLTEQLTILGVLLLTSKGAAAVTGGGFITLAATLATLGGKLPVEGLALLLGVDRFMSEARAITNLIGNGVATIVVAKWENALDSGRMTRVLNGETVAEADDPEVVADEALKPADLAKAA
ncbi:MAG: C4-dicarboxylate transporter DctA, partial [Betaproteobacteria bacterium]|nr:C4-dicarboxylate transporter DctA [Betaproteobacteria bacterium]